MMPSIRDDARRYSTTPLHIRQQILVQRLAPYKFANWFGKFAQVVADEPECMTIEVYDPCMRIYYESRLELLEVAARKRVILKFAATIEE